MTWVHASPNQYSSSLRLTSSSPPLRNNRPAQETQQQCLDKCYTTFETCCGMTQTEVKDTEQYDDFWGNCDDANLYEKCTNEEINCRGACPYTTNDKVTTKLIENFDNDNEGTAGLRGHHLITEDAFMSSDDVPTASPTIQTPPPAPWTQRQDCIGKCVKNWTRCCMKTGAFQCPTDDNDIRQHPCDYKYDICAGMCSQADVEATNEVIADLDNDGTLQYTMD
jgi:hypothetical protein